MFDKYFYERDMETGWIRGLVNERHEERNFLSRAKIGITAPIMKELVVIDETCLQDSIIIYDPEEIYYRECIKYTSFFTGWDD